MSEEKMVRRAANRRPCGHSTCPWRGKMMEHKTTLEYEGGTAKLVEDIGNLRYDALQQFLTDLGRKVRIDANADRTRGREKLSGLLEKTADRLLESAAAVGAAWILCKPHMENEDGS